MKNGRHLVVEAIDVRGQVIRWTVPISGFGKVYDGPQDIGQFWSFYQRPPTSRESPPKPWRDDTLAPHLRP